MDKERAILTKVTPQFLDSLEYSWTAELKDNNGNIHPIWWTAWAMRKRQEWEILTVSSDYPKQEINRCFTIN